MSRIFFEPEYRELLLNPFKWQLVSSLFPPDVSPLMPAEHQDLRGYHEALEKSKRHVHAVKQIIIVLKGHCTYIFKEKVYPWRPGMVFFHDAFESHDDGNGILDLPLTYLYAFLVGGRFDISLVTHRQGTTYKESEMTNVVSGYVELDIPFEKHWSELAEKRNLSTQIIRMKMLALTELFASTLLEKQATGQRDLPTNEVDLKMGEICSYIRDKGGRGVTVDKMAYAIGCSRRQFPQIFKDFTGNSLQEYINICRMQKAEELLNKGINPKEISSILGFSNTAGFSRWQKMHKDQSKSNRIK